MLFRNKGNNMTEQLNELESKLKQQDWTWEMSDDSSAYSKGRESEMKLREAAKDLGSEGIALFNKYYNAYAYPKGNELKD